MISAVDKKEINEIKKQIEKIENLENITFPKFKCLQAANNALQAITIVD